MFTSRSGSLWNLPEAQTVDLLCSKHKNVAYFPH
uniref:Uncharacterized protein n=1 Tax=Anguilla anguilla TaxID=7936 RepID=A0A0E9QXZ0_ANGAN